MERSFRACEGDQPFVAWWYSDGSSDQRAVKVAVLPFSDLSPEGRWGWLAEALTFELTGHIGDMGTYEILPRAMVARLSPDELPEDVDLVLDGFVQNAVVEDRVRVGVQLIKLPEGHQLWSESFDGIRDAPDELQQQIATRVARFFHDSVIGMGLTEPYLMAGPKAPEARTAYLNYLRHSIGGDPEQLRIWLERTLELDPTWGLGYLRLAGEYVSRAGAPDGNAWADRARARSPTLGVRAWLETIPS